jgi:redox-sensitive bicupin YhaK (pirin superfamily)
VNFGVLRVMNDDFVQANRGFGTHGHSNMEIVTYVVEGSLTHQDSMGTEESLGRGSVQFMTAGKGVMHSEFNMSREKGLRFIQTWIAPRMNGLEPNYGSFDPNTGEETVCIARNQWRHLVSDVMDTSTRTPVQIEQDANLFVAEMDQGRYLSLSLEENRMAYILCVEGSVKVKISSDGDEVNLQRHDGCEVTPISKDKGGELVFRSDEAAHVLVFEMEAVEGAGRRDI